MPKVDHKRVLLQSLKEIREHRSKLLENLKEMNRIESEHIRVLEKFGVYMPTAADPLGIRGRS